ncbi:MAG: hypothetical protein KDD44_03915 [Bdellovibrionales bacterium]|nr:hypothetical protein [Bdellovibrionales bacterium]
MNTQQNSTNWLVVLALVGGIWYASQHATKVDPGPIAPGYSPSPEMVTATAQIKSIAASHPNDAKRIAPFFSAAADIVQRDSTTIANTAQFQAWIRDGSILRYQGTDLASKLPGFSDALHAAVTSTVGDEQKAFDAATRSKTVELLRAICWALGGTTS